MTLERSEVMIYQRGLYNPPWHFFWYEGGLSAYALCGDPIPLDKMGSATFTSGVLMCEKCLEVSSMWWRRAHFKSNPTLPPSLCFDILPIQATE